MSCICVYVGATFIYMLSKKCFIVIFYLFYYFHMLFHEPNKLILISRFVSAI